VCFVRSQPQHPWSTQQCTVPLFSPHISCPARRVCFAQATAAQTANCTKATLLSYYQEIRDDDMQNSGHISTAQEA
jgi:hypothetical protein